MPGKGLFETWDHHESGGTKFDDAEVSREFETDFGRELFNVYTARDRRGLLFSRRLFVVRRMLRAMLDAEEEIKGAFGEGKGVF